MGSNSSKHCASNRPGPGNKASAKKQGKLCKTRHLQSDDAEGNRSMKRIEMQKRKIQRQDEDLLCAIRSSLLSQDTQKDNSTSQTATNNLAKIPRKPVGSAPSRDNGHSDEGLAANIYAALGEQSSKQPNVQKFRKEPPTFPSENRDEKLASPTTQTMLMEKPKDAIFCNVTHGEPVRFREDKVSRVVSIFNPSVNRSTSNASMHGPQSNLQPVAGFSLRSHNFPKDKNDTAPSTSGPSRSTPVLDRNIHRPRARTLHKDAGLMSAVRATMGEQPLLEEMELDELHKQQRNMILDGTPPTQFAGLDDEDGQVMTALRTSLKEVKISDLRLHERPLTKNTECVVCTDIFSPSEIAMGFISTTCDHSAPEIALQYTCKGCVQQHLDVQVQSGATILTCPICLAELTYHDVKKWATPRTFTRYDRLRTRDAITSDPKFIWCSNPSCDAGQVHESGPDAPIVICNSCATKTCFNHQQGWHNGFSCAEFDDPQIADARLRREQEEIEAIQRQHREAERRIREQVEKDEEIARALAADEDRQVAERKAAEARKQREAEEKRRREAEEAERQQKAAEQARLKKEREERAKRLAEEKAGEAAVLDSTKLCPGPKCTYRVHKVDGCKHMTCTRCQYEWCWICGQKWITGHLRNDCSPPGTWPKRTISSWS